MYTWIIYDISKNKARAKVAEKCKQLGLKRVQKSVFLGKTRKSLLKKFQQEVIQFINLRTDILFIVPMTQEEYVRMVLLGNGIDKKKLNRKKQLIFI